jgi:tellurite resistance-related uncharacterized protein
MYFKYILSDIRCMSIAYFGMAVMNVPKPYKTTPVFTETTLPAALRADHNTKAGVWAVIRVLSGRLRLHIAGDGSTVDLSPDWPGIVQPEQKHWVEAVGAMSMRVEFYTSPPHIEAD